MSSIKYENKELYNRVKKDADKKFSKNSYVKNLWILNEYEKRGGKTKKTGDKPKKTEIKKSIEGYVVDFPVEIVLGSKDKTNGRGLNKPFRTPSGPKKFSVFVKNNKGNIVKVNFGDPNMKIKRDNPEARKSFRARHKCDQAKDKTKPSYWSCKMWSEKPVSKVVAHLDDDWDGETFYDEEFIYEQDFSLIYVDEEISESAD